MLKKYTFNSDINGYQVLFLGAIHGNEPCGSQAIFKVVEKFASHSIFPLQGSVSFIPICNPLAFERNIRQIDENLNRIIRPYTSPQTYEQHLAVELVEHISSADIIIDLHSTSAPAAEPFIFSDYPDKLADQIAAAQNIKYIIKGWPQIYADNNTTHDFSTGNCAHTYGKTCLTVECGYNLDPLSIQTAYHVIMNTLLSLGILEGYPSLPVKQYNIIMDKLYIKTQSGRLSQEFHNLDKIKQGQTIAVYDNGNTIICPQDSYMLLPKADAKVNDEWFYLGHLQNN